MMKSSEQVTLGCSLNKGLQNEILINVKCCGTVNGIVSWIKARMSRLEFQEEGSLINAANAARLNPYFYPVMRCGGCGYIKQTESCAKLLSTRHCSVIWGASNLPKQEVGGHFDIATYLTNTPVVNQMIRARRLFLLAILLIHFARRRSPPPTSSATSLTEMLPY